MGGQHHLLIMGSRTGSPYSTEGLVVWRFTTRPNQYFSGGPSITPTLINSPSSLNAGLLLELRVFLFGE
jgi:hypothetical protein